MSRQDIADFLGLTIETVSRTFTKLERDGVIAIMPGSVCLLDPARAEALAAASGRRLTHLLSRDFACPATMYWRQVFDN